MKNVSELHHLVKEDSPTQSVHISKNPDTNASDSSTLSVWVLSSVDFCDHPKMA